MNLSASSKLPKAVHRWLAFQAHCNRSDVFSESYMTQPVAEFVLANHSGRFESEHTHPSFVTRSKGRPKQVDFALVTKNTGAIEAVIECKWAGVRNLSKQAIVDDLLRLECYRDPDRQVSRYFLVAGKKDNFISNFRELRYRDGGNHAFTKRLLSFSTRRPEIVLGVFSFTGSIRKYFRSFYDEYKSEPPKTLRTTLVSASYGDEIYVFMWRVSSSKNRKTYKAALPDW